MKLKNLTKLLVSVLMAFCAFTFVACSDDDEGGSADPAVNGIWVNSGDVLVLNNGSFEMTMSYGMGEEKMKGTYTTSGDKVTIKVTHLYDEGKWYSRAELKNLGYSDGDLDRIFSPWTTEYSVNGNTLMFGGETYTKQ